MFRLIAVMGLIAAVLTAAPVWGGSGKDAGPTLSMLTPAASGLITPTYEWIDLYCSVPTLDGAPLAPGDTIFVYDPDGILAGMDVVRADGLYGFMPVYRDDAFSAEDEGAEPGDTLRFAINGTPVMVMPPVIWTRNGESFAVCQFQTAAPVYGDVFIDIKPGSCPNPFNLNENIDNGKAVLPVAVLGTAEFDVHRIDPSTIVLAGAPMVRWGYEDVSRPKEDPDDTCSCHNKRGDGYLDLTLKFYRSDVAEALAGAADREYVPLVLTGELYDGTPISGADCVRVMRRGNAGGPNGKVAVPADFGLANHPNPFNPTTSIAFSLPETGAVTLRVYDVQGRLVRTLVNGVLEAGAHTVEWNGTDGRGSAVASGVYFYRLSTGEREATKKMVLMK